MSVVLESVPRPANRVKEDWGDRLAGAVHLKVKLTNVADALGDTESALSIIPREFATDSTLIRWAQDAVNMRTDAPTTSQ